MLLREGVVACEDGHVHERQAANTRDVAENERGEL